MPPKALSSRFAERGGRRFRDTVTDECVGLFTPDKDGYTHTSRGRVAVIAARRGTVCVAKWVASSDFLNSRSAPSIYSELL